MSIDYLGVVIDRQGTDKLEIQERIEEVFRFYYSINNSFIGKK